MNIINLKTNNMTELEELVIEEAILLKQHATKKELDSLDYGSLAGGSTHHCIYGQMTGNCENERTYELIRKCCSRVYKSGKHENRIVSRLGSKPKKLSDFSIRLDYYVSPIENFVFKNKKDVYNSSEKVKKLINFLKGNLNKLEF